MCFVEQITMNLFQLQAEALGAAAQKKEEKVRCQEVDLLKGGIEKLEGEMEALQEDIQRTSAQLDEERHKREVSRRISHHSSHVRLVRRHKVSRNCMVNKTVGGG
jgi:hypothetical protein